MFNNRRRVIEETIHVTFDESSITKSPISSPSDDELDFSESVFPSPVNTDNVPPPTSEEPHHSDSDDGAGISPLVQNTCRTLIPAVQVVPPLSTYQSSPSVSVEHPVSTEADDSNEDLSSSSEANPSVPPILQRDSPTPISSVPSNSRAAPQDKWTKDHPIDLIIGDQHSGVQTRSATSNTCLYVNFISLIEPKKIEEALQDPSWVSAMQEELTQFECNRVWSLVPKPAGKTIIGSKWIFRNKMDEEGVVI